MTKGHSQIFVGVLFAVVAAILLVHALSFPMVPKTASREPIGPYAWPKVLLGGIFILSAYVAFTGIRDVRTESASSEVHEKVLSLGKESRIIVFTMLALALYIILLKYTGFILTTWVWLSVVIYLYGIKQWTTVLGVSTAVTAVLYALFIRLLHVPMPRGAFIFQTLSRMLGH